MLVLYHHPFSCLPIVNILLPMILFDVFGCFNLSICFLDNLQTRESLFLVTFYQHVSRWFLLASPRHLPVSVPQNAEVTGVVSHV